MQTLVFCWGDETLQEIHVVLGNSLVGLAALHFAAAIVMGRLEQTSLIRAMFTGIKTRF